MREQRGEDKLWKIEISEEGNFYQFYLVSPKKPVFIAETAFGKFQRMFSLFKGGYEATSPAPELPPIFYISRRQKATVQQAQDMHGFDLQKLTAQYIFLSVENLHRKSLYEISLFSRKIKSLFQKKYILAKDKKEATEHAKKFKPSYRTKVTKAKKMDCYPIVKVTEDSIVLKRKVK